MPTLDLGQVVGPQGPQGPQGIQGPQGKAGPQGTAGANGITPNLQVGTVTTLDPDSSATVTRQADSPDAAPVFDFGIPRGHDSESDGDMHSDTYDPTGKAQDIFAYTDRKVAEYAYSKTDSLKATTAARIGLPATAVPDDVFNAILPSVGSIANIVSGSYVGTGTSNFELNIGFRPKIVLISQYSIYSIGVEIGIFIDDCRGLKLALSNAALTAAVIPVGWTDSGLVIGDATSGVHLNYPEAPYHYVAIK